MYKEIYTIPFKSIEENSYKIIIEKKGYLGTSTELVGASSPFTVEDELENPLEPFKLSSATLSIFGGDYLQNLFTPDPQGVRIKFLKNGTIEWLGFITNDTYSQDYSNIEFTYEIELVNPISSLKNTKYESLSVNKTFIELIKEAITETHSELKNLYLPTFINNGLDTNIYELISLSSDNFVDEQDEAMSYYEILEEIAKYLGVTISVDKDAVYFMDYIGLGKGFRGYYKYNLVTESVTLETLYHSETIQSLDYVSNSSTLQINSGKNKAKVTCSLYDIDEVLPKFDAEGSEYLFSKRGLYAYGKDESRVSNAYIARFFEQPKFTFYKYGVDGTLPPVSPPSNRPTGGGWPDDDDDTSLDGVRGSWFVRTTNYPLDAIMSRQRNASLSFTNEVMTRRFTSTKDAEEGKILGEVPIIKIESEKSLSYKEKTSFILNLDIKFHKDELLYYTSEDEHKGQCFLPYINVPISLKIGEYYYNGIKWGKTFKKFNAKALVNQDDFYGEYYSLENTNDFSYGVTDESGYLIRTPDFMLSGKLELTIYNTVFDDVVVQGKSYTYLKMKHRKTKPQYVWLYRRTYPQYSYIKNIQLTHTTKQTGDIYGDKDDEEGKKDIVYENVIDEKFVEDAKEVDLKICTYPDDYPKLCWSTTFINDSYLKKLIYNPLNLTEKPEVILLHKIIDYYKEPKYQLSIPVTNKLLYPYSIITDKNLPNKRFIYAGSEIDYEYEKNTINILEI